MSCIRFAVSVWFAGDSHPSWVCPEKFDCVSTSQADLPPLSATWDEEGPAREFMRRCGRPWSLALREPPSLVEVDVTPLLCTRRERLVRELVSLCQEIGEPLAEVASRWHKSAAALRVAAESGSTGFFDDNETDIIAALRGLEQLESLGLLVWWVTE